ncbi:MAG: Isochorismate synthase MenF [Myxococcota bacterium]|nr:Isochorismate synthase MenF [Myxococcota bacterium]
MDDKIQLRERLQWLDLHPERTLFYFRDRDGAERAAAGVETAVFPGAEQRFERSMAWAKEAASRSRANWFFGGFAFDGAADDSAWRLFGPALFASAGEAAEQVSGSEASAYPRLPFPRVLMVEDATTEAGWKSSVETLLGAFRSSELSKVTLARQRRLRLDDSPRLSEVAARLIEQYPRHYIHVLRLPSPDGLCAIVGASPERLIKRSGRFVETEALAGTVRAEARNPSARDHGKLAREHQHVVDHITKTLSRWCSHVEAAGAPAWAASGAISHLKTPIFGRLDGSGHVLQLAAALHPTPAICGTPPERAARWISQLEPLPRGWYAGGVGWFDTDGNGEFAVGIRNALIYNNVVVIAAGAGIVEGSDPSHEYEETEWKLQAMMRVFGAAA